jgi:HSP20 family protein
MVRSLIPWGAKLPGRLADMEREMENLMETWFAREGNSEVWGPMGRLAFNPRGDLVETPTGFEVAIDLPGMKPEDFKVEMNQGDLWISGEKTEEKKENGKTYHRVERRHGTFQRVFPLPAKVKEGEITAQYEGGVLKVMLPKAEEVVPKQIPVKSV